MNARARGRLIHFTRAEEKWAKPPGATVYAPDLRLATSVLPRADGGGEWGVVIDHALNGSNGYMCIHIGAGEDFVIVLFDGF